MRRPELDHYRKRRYLYSESFLSTNILNMTYIADMWTLCLGSRGTEEWWKHLCFKFVRTHQTKGNKMGAWTLLFVTKQKNTCWKQIVPLLSQPHCKILVSFEHIKIFNSFWDLEAFSFILSISIYILNISVIPYFLKRATDHTGNYWCVFAKISFG